MRLFGTTWPTKETLQPESLTTPLREPSLATGDGIPGGRSGFTPESYRVWLSVSA